ncbi:MAG: PAS domain S-box protein [Deltaproteobacteria bacterium]|nr:PAS domain S-box protein [Deltaproteobacteria bacterium]
MHAIGTTSKDEKGKVTKLFGTAQDITDLKRAEEALRESEEKYRTLFEDSKDAIYIATREGNIVSANQSFVDVFGYTKEEITEWKTEDTYVDADYRSRFTKMIEENGFVKDFEAKLRKKNEAEMDCLITATIQRSTNGNIVGYQGIIRDITELKRAHEEREKLISELKKALAEVKTLSGMLPICANCKKIRDDKDYWNRIEIYIGKHSEAEFSHGICPECTKELYPEFELSPGKS